MTSIPTESTRAIGQAAELLAVEFYSRLGYTILATNYRAGKREIDIIASKDDLVVFVEVKCRTKIAFGMPESTLSAAQLNRIQEASVIWQEENAYSGRIQFDIIAVAWKNNQAQIRHFQDVQ